MKLIQMTKTMAGPGGVRPAFGRPFTVGDEEAAQLVAAGAAEIIAVITEQAEADVLTPDRETAVRSAPEQAIQAKAAPKRVKKA
jgi:hypothetical protein